VIQNEKTLGWEFRVKRIVDLLLALILLPFVLLLSAVIAIAIKMTSPGPVLYWSRRVGMNNHEFMMPKFRSMRIDAPEVATHLLVGPEAYLTPVGRVLRQTSLDEIPQVYSIVRGEISFVGPRPALFNQHDLVELRTARGVHALVPGLTGWAQINGRDALSIERKVEFDYEYAQKRSLLFDLKVLWLTLVKVMRREGVSH
jgi:O-antigen biosynthesis protein WbqP